MDKLYTQPSLNDIPTPSKKSITLIMQYAAAYDPISLPNGFVDNLAN